MTDFLETYAAETEVCRSVPERRLLLKASGTSTGVCNVTTANESLLQGAELLHGQVYCPTASMDVCNQLVFASA